MCTSKILLLFCKNSYFRSNWRFMALLWHPIAHELVAIVKVPKTCWRSALDAGWPGLPVFCKKTSLDLIIVVEWLLFALFGVTYNKRIIGLQFVFKFITDWISWFRSFLSKFPEFVISPSPRFSSQILQMSFPVVYVTRVESFSACHRLHKWGGFLARSLDGYLINNSF